MTDKTWLKHYPAGMAFEIDADRYDSLPDLLEKTVGKLPTGRPSTTSAAASASANWMHSRAISQPTCRACRAWRRATGVAIMSPNLLQYPVALFGICVPA